MTGQSERSFLSVDFRLYLSLSHFPFKSFHSIFYFYLFLFNLFLISTVHAFDVGINFCGLTILQSS